MNIIGMGIAGAGEADKYLKQVLDANLPLVDKMIVWGDAPDAETEKVLLSYDKIEYHRYPESIWAQKQWLIKESLFLRYVVPHSPDWVLSFDFDEIFDSRIDRAKLEELGSAKATSYYFNFIQLWDDEQHMRTDAGWGDFWNVRFWKYQPHMDQSWLRKSLHCGLAPVYAYQQGIYAPYIVKHYGYMNPVDRAKKVERYTVHDPQRVFQSKSWYDSMTKEGDIRAFDEGDYITRILPQLMPRYQKETKMQVQPQHVQKIYMVRRKKDGKIVEMSERTYKEMNANRTFERFGELVGEAKSQNTMLEAPVVSRETEEAEFKCKQCDFVAKKKMGLTGHMKKHAPKKNDNPGAGV